MAPWFLEWGRGYHSTASWPSVRPSPTSRRLSWRLLRLGEPSASHPVQAPALGESVPGTVPSPRCNSPHKQVVFPMLTDVSKGNEGCKIPAVLRAPKHSIPLPWTPPVPKNPPHSIALVSGSLGPTTVSPFSSQVQASQSQPCLRPLANTQANRQGFITVYSQAGAQGFISLETWNPATLRSSIPHTSCSPRVGAGRIRKPSGKKRQREGNAWALNRQVAGQQLVEPCSTLRVQTLHPWTRHTSSCCLLQTSCRESNPLVP